MSKVRRVKAGEYLEGRTDGENAYDVLKAADEEQVCLKVLAHGAHPWERVGNETGEALLVPASWFEAVEGVLSRMDGRLAALEEEEAALTTYCSETWDAASVVIKNSELEGLDTEGFKKLLRQKIRRVGDNLLKAWEERDSGCRGSVRNG